jgi:membrane protease YdiL (CAAX protease family)
LGLALVAYVLVAGLWVAAVHPHSAANTLADVKHQGTINVVLAIVAVSASAPIVEEIFRGLVYRSLRNRLYLAGGTTKTGAAGVVGHLRSSASCQP